MEQPFADSTNTQDVAQEKVQLSSAIAEQILDKQIIADNVQQHFTKWDKDESGSLSLLELSYVYDSQEASYKDRATASILAQNYLLVRDTCANQLEGFPMIGLTDAGFQHLKSVFGSDKTESGITQKDLTAFSKLTADGGEQRFTKDVEKAEQESLALNGFYTGISTTLAGLFGKRFMFASGPANLLNAAAFAGSAYGTFVSGQATFDAIGKNDMPEMEMQFKRRKAMLDSWDAPRP